jgi:YD repeat-containing protein
VKVDLAELEAIVGATQKRALTDEEHQKLEESHKLLVDLLLPDDLNNEKTRAVMGDEKPPAEPKPKAPGHGRKKREEFGAARTVPVAHPELKAGQLCPCGCGWKLQRLKKAKVFRHFVGQVPIQVTFYELEQLRSNGCDSVYSAPLPDGVGPETYDATAVSVIALSKYGMGLPFYRQAALYGCLGTPIAVATQYELVAEAAERIRPAYNELVRLAAQGKLAHYDDTSSKILKFERDHEDRRSGIFTSGIISVHEAFQIALLFTGRDHAGENMGALLKKREPDLPAMLRMSDALSSNFAALESDEDVIACCMAHGRRNFVKIAEDFPEDCRHILTAIGTIYHNDRQCQEAGHSPDERLAHHQQNSQPILEGLKEWLERKLKDKEVEPNSKLGKAMQYLLNHWGPLTLFTRVPGAPLDNNIAERALKKVVLHRKNSLFYRTIRGARVGDLYMTIIQTCQLNGVDPYDYLTELQRHSSELAADPSAWLPWTYRNSPAELAQAC